jgi:choline dehydrogenase
MYIKHCYISVGGGTAGSVLANRLSEDPDITVLVLEAGGEESGFPNVDIPLLSTFFRYKEYDWNYYITLHLVVLSESLHVCRRAHVLVTLFVFVCA